MARLYREYVAGTTAQYRLLQRIVDRGAREISPSRTSSLPTLRALYAAIKPFTSNATWAISELWEYSSLSDVLPYRLHGQTDGTLSQDVRLAVELGHGGRLALTQLVPRYLIEERVRFDLIK